MPQIPVKLSVTFYYFPCVAGSSTTLTIADAAELMDFMGHTCCQTKLNKIWKGKMALYTSTWKIVLCMFLPFFLPLIKFCANEYEIFSSDDLSENKVAPEKVNL